MEEYTISEKLEFMIILVCDMAERFAIPPLKAYFYMSKYGAIDLIERHYGIMHTLSFEDVLDSIISFCARKGGELV